MVVAVRVRDVVDVADRVAVRILDVVARAAAATAGSGAPPGGVSTSARSESREYQISIVLKLWSYAGRSQCRVAGAAFPTRPVAWHCAANPLPAAITIARSGTASSASSACSVGEVPSCGPV